MSSDTPNLDGLPTYDPQARCCPQKPLPHVLEKKAKQQTKQAREDTFRAAIWTRDAGKSRASGKNLSRSALDYDQRGEVHHVLKRSTNPEEKFAPARGILLSKTEHTLAEMRCPQAPEHHLLEILGPDDLGQLQAFVWRSVDGLELRRRIG